MVRLLAPSPTPPTPVRPSRPGPLRASLEPAVAAVAPGQRARFRLRLDNRTREPVVLRLAVEPPSDGWRAFLPVRDAYIHPGSALTLFLRVDAPAAAVLGERVTFGLRGCGSATVRLAVEAVVA